MTLSDLFFLVLVLLLFADIATTISILSRGGREQNPVLAWLFQRLGIEAVLLPTKALIIGWVGYLYAAHRLPTWFLGVAVAFYLLVVFYNWRQRHK